MNRSTRISRKRKRGCSSDVVGSTSTTDINTSIVDLSNDVDDEPDSTGVSEQVVIDLTMESPLSSSVPSPEVVDLTQLSGSTHHHSSRRRRSYKRGRKRENRPPLMHHSTHINAISFISDDSDSELEMLQIIGSSPTLAERTETLNTSAEDALSPTMRKEIVCPICMESERQIKRRRQLVSTVCGHIFCNSCITNAVKTQHKCPTCRKKLTLKQFHQIFL
ncbi:E3 ubiquitin-protein ligase RNF4-like [Anneissia japonica]|uniref:E3 ubiquitin-protein ligase RNF4-like n=1 Tax=Anneissia japonica TaxID=1529436 RepID=UPI0014257D58|nr:E3 ubiquitin-protein ligase RNF4-like [Anneissia japonica]